MLRKHENIQELLTDATNEELYIKLIEQLNKDFLLANIEEAFSDKLKPLELKVALHDVVYRLIQEKFAEYLNLLYIMDVAEANVKALESSDLVNFSEQVVFLMLRREWQKVWFKNRL